MLDLQTWSVKNSWHFGLNLTSSLHISLTFSFSQLQDKYKSGLLSTFLEYDYESIGSWNWEKCLRRLCHWHCAKQVPECRTSISCTKLVELAPALYIWVEHWWYIRPPEEEVEEEKIARRSFWPPWVLSCVSVGCWHGLCCWTGHHYMSCYKGGHETKTGSVTTNVHHWHLFR